MHIENIGHHIQIDKLFLAQVRTTSNNAGVEYIYMKSINYQNWNRLWTK